MATTNLTTMAKPAAGFCKAEILLPEITTLSGPTIITYYVPSGTPITGPIPVSGMDTLATLNDKFRLDPVRASSGFSITVVSFTNTGLKVRIVKKSSVQITDMATGQVIEQLPHSSPFICTPRRRRGIGAPAGAVRKFLEEQAQRNLLGLGAVAVERLRELDPIVVEPPKVSVSRAGSILIFPITQPVTGPTSNLPRGVVSPARTGQLETNQSGFTRGYTVQPVTGPTSNLGKGVVSPLTPGSTNRVSQGGASDR